MLADLHQHLVYGVDDGPEEQMEALEMLRLADGQGIADIVCTSHDCPGVRPLDRERYLRHWETLRALAAGEKLQVRLHTGSEIMYSPDTIQALRQGKLLTLAGSDRLLVEFYPDVPWALMKKAAEDLREAGGKMVLAHIERYACLQQTEHLAQLREEYGVAAQMNAATVLESSRLFRGRWIRRVLDDRLVDVVASDAHHSTGRVCRLAQAHELLQKKYGTEYADQLCVHTPLMLIKH